MDRELTQRSSLLDLLEPRTGDSVMADRGFTISDLLGQRGVTLNIPPNKVSDQLTPNELTVTQGLPT